MLKKKCDEKYSFSVINNVDFASFPPIRPSLVQHTLRVNYQVRIWKLATEAISEIPKPWEGHGWLENGEPNWCHPEWILPPTFADILEETQEKQRKSPDEDEDDEIDETESETEMSEEMSEEEKKEENSDSDDE